MSDPEPLVLLRKIAKSADQVAAAAWLIAIVLTLQYCDTCGRAKGKPAVEAQP